MDIDLKNIIIFKIFFFIYEKVGTCFINKTVALTINEKCILSLPVVHVNY